MQQQRPTSAGRPTNRRIRRFPRRPSGGLAGRSDPDGGPPSGSPERSPSVARHAAAADAESRDARPGPPLHRNRAGRAGAPPRLALGRRTPQRAQNRAAALRATAADARRRRRRLPVAAGEAEGSRTPARPPPLLGPVAVGSWRGPLPAFSIQQRRRAAGDQTPETKAEAESTGKRPHGIPNHRRKPRPPRQNPGIQKQTGTSGRSERKKTGEGSNEADGGENEEPATAPPGPGAAADAAAAQRTAPPVQPSGARGAAETPARRRRNLDGPGRGAALPGTTAAGGAHHGKTNCTGRGARSASRRMTSRASALTTPEIRSSQTEQRKTPPASTDARRRQSGDSHGRRRPRGRRRAGISGQNQAQRARQEDNEESHDIAADRNGQPRPRKETQNTTGRKKENRSTKHTNRRNKPPSTRRSKENRRHRKRRRQDARSKRHHHKRKEDRTYQSTSHAQHSAQSPQLRQFPGSSSGRPQTRQSRPRRSLTDAAAARRETSRRRRRSLRIAKRLGIGEIIPGADTGHRPEPADVTAPQNPGQPPGTQQIPANGGLGHADHGQPHAARERGSQERPPHGPQKQQRRQQPQRTQRPSTRRRHLSQCIADPPGYECRGGGQTRRGKPARHRPGKHSTSPRQIPLK